MFGFGEKKKLKNDTDDMNFDDFDDIGFDDPEEPSGDRKASTFSKWKHSALDGARAKRDDVNFRRQVLKATLPKDYTPVIDTVDTASNEIGKLWREQEKQWEANKRDIRGAVKPFSKLAGAFGLNKLQGWMEGNYESGGSSSEPTQEELDTLKIHELMGDIFAKTGQQQAQIAQHQEAVSDAQYDEESNTRHKSLAAQSEANVHLKGINRELASNRGYTEQVTHAYYSKTLELQARQLITQQRIAQALGMYRTEALTELKSIHKNTGLPDFLKLEMSEVAKQQYMQRVYSKALEPFTGVGQRVAMKVLGKVRSKLTEFWSFIGEGAQTLKMQNEDADQDGGEGASGFYSNLLRDMMTGGLVGKAIDKTNDYLSPKLREYLNRKGMDVYGNSLKTIISQLPSAVNKGMRDGFGNGLLDGIVDFLDLRGESIQGNRQLINESELHLDKAAFMDNKMRLAVVDVIPGWLKKIYETTYYGIHKKDPKDLHWDHLRGGFTDRKEALDKVVDKVVKKDNIIRAEEAVDNYMEGIDPDQLLSEKAHKFMRDWLVRERNSSGSMSVFDLLGDQVKMSEDLKKEYLEKLPYLLKIPEKQLDKIMNAETSMDIFKVMSSPGMKSTNDKIEDLTRRANEIRTSGAYSIEDLQKVIHEFPEFRNDFVKLGLAIRNLDGSLEANPELDESLRQTHQRKHKYKQNSGFKFEKDGSRDQVIFDEDERHYDSENKFTRVKNLKAGSLNLNEVRKLMLRRKNIKDQIEAQSSLFNGIALGDDYIITPQGEVILKSAKSYTKFLEGIKKTSYNSFIDNVDKKLTPFNERFRPDYAHRADFKYPKYLDYSPFTQDKVRPDYVHTPEFNPNKTRFASGGEIESFAKGGDIKDVPNVQKETQRILSGQTKEHPITKNDISYKIQNLKAGKTKGKADEERVVKTHGGEFVVNKDATDLNRPMLEAVNKLGAPLINKDGTVNSVYYKTFGFKSPEEFNGAKKQDGVKTRVNVEEDKLKAETIFKLLQSIDFEKAQTTQSELNQVLDSKVPAEKRLAILQRVYTRQHTLPKLNDRRLGGKFVNKIRDLLKPEKKDETHATHEEIINTLWKQVTHSKVVVSTQDKAFIFDQTKPLNDRVSKITSVLAKQPQESKPKEVKAKVNQPKYYTGSQDKSNVLHTLGDGIQNKRLAQLWNQVDTTKVKISEHTYNLIKDEKAPIAQRLKAVKDLLKHQSGAPVKISHVDSTSNQQGYHSVSHSINVAHHHADKSNNVKEKTYKTLNNIRHDDQRVFITSKPTKKPEPQVKPKVDVKPSKVKEAKDPPIPKVQAKTPILNEIKEALLKIDFYANHHTPEEFAIITGKDTHPEKVLKTAKDILARQESKPKASKKMVSGKKVEINRNTRDAIFNNVSKSKHVDAKGHLRQDQRKKVNQTLDRANTILNQGNVFTTLGSKVSNASVGNTNLKDETKELYNSVKSTVNHASQKTLDKILSAIDQTDRKVKWTDLKYTKDPKIPLAKRQAKALSILAAQKARIAKQDPKEAAKQLLQTTGKHASLRFDKLIDTDGTGKNVQIKNKIVGMGKKVTKDAAESAKKVGKETASKGKKLLKDINLEASGHLLHRDRTLTAVSTFLKEVENPKMYNLPIDLYFKDAMSVPFVTKLGFKNKLYYDQKTKKVINNPSEITGTITDKQGSVIATLQDLATRQVVTRAMKPYKLIGLTKALRQYMSMTEFASHKFSIVADIQSVKDKIDKAKELKDKFLIDKPVDVYNRSKELLLQATRFKARKYQDVNTGNVLWSHHDITGPVKDLDSGEIVLTKAQLEDGLFDAENNPLKINKFKQVRNMMFKRGKEVYDKHLSKHVNKYGGKVLHRLAAIGEKRTKLNFDKDPIDVYVAGDKDPRITALDFKEGKVSCAGKVIKSHSGISGPVTKGDNIVITDEDLEHGLVDAHGEKLHLPLMMSGVKRFAHYAKAAFLPKTGMLSKAWNFLKMDGSKRESLFDEKVSKARVAFDVYLKGDMQTPVLYKKKFEKGEYISKKSSKVIYTPEYIDGPILGIDGNVILTQEDLDKGLVDYMGNKVHTHAFDRDSNLAKKTLAWLGLTKRLSKKRLEEKSTQLEDVKVKGSDDILIKADDIKAGKYYRKDNKKPAKSYKDLTAGVVDEKGNEIIGKKELKQGLETASGKPLSTAIAIQGAFSKLSNMFRVGSWMWEREQKHKDDKDPKKKDEKTKDKKHSWIGKLIGGLIAPLTAIAGGLALKIKKALNETFIGAFGKLLPKLLGKKNMIADAVGVLGGLGGGRGRGRIGGMWGKLPGKYKLALAAAGTYGAYKGYGALEDHWGGSDDGPDASEGATNKNQMGLDGRSYRDASEGQEQPNRGGLWNGIKDNAGAIAMGAAGFFPMQTAKLAWGATKLVGNGIGKAVGWGARKAGGLALRGGTGLISRAAPWLARAAGMAAMTGEGVAAGGAAVGGLAAAGAALLPEIIAGAAVAAVGYGAYWVGKKIFEAWKDGENPWNRFRMAQYGFDHNDSATTEKIAKIETLAQGMVHVTKHGVGFKADDKATTEIFKVLGLKDENGIDIEEQKKRFPSVVQWFRGRFIRVYASYVQALNKITGKGEIGDLQKLDRDQQTELLRQVHFTQTENNPYFAMMSPFEDPSKCEFGFREVDSISRRLRSKIDELPKPKVKAKGEFKVSGKDSDAKPRPKPEPEVKTVKKPADGSSPDTAKPNTPTKEVVKEPNIHDVIDHTVNPDREAMKLKDEFGKKPLDSIQAATRQVQYINKAALAINRMHTQAMTQTTIATTKATDSIFDQVIDSFTTRGKQLWSVVKDAGAKFMNGDFLQSGKTLVKGGLETARGVMTDGFEIGHSAIQKAGSTASRIGGEVSNAFSGIGNFFTGNGGELSKVPQAKGNGWNGVKDTLLYASRAVGTDPAIMAQIAAIESGFKPEAKAKTSSATGLFQFTDSTWKEVVKKHGKKYGIDSSTSPLDARANALMGAAFIKDNAEVVKSVKGGGATAQDIYMAHFLGPGGVKSFLKGLSANPNDLAQNHVARNVPGANKDIFFSQSGQPNTLQQVYNLLGGRLATRAKAFGVNLDELRGNAKVADMKQSAVTKGMAAITKTANIGGTNTLSNIKSPSSSPSPSSSDTIAPTVSPKAKEAAKKVDHDKTKPAKVVKEVAKDTPKATPTSTPDNSLSTPTTPQTSPVKPNSGSGVSDAEPLTSSNVTNSKTLDIMNREASTPTLSPVEIQREKEEKSISEKMESISSGRAGTQVERPQPKPPQVPTANPMDSTNDILNRSLTVQGKMLDKLGDIHKAIVSMVTGQDKSKPDGALSTPGLTTPQLGSDQKQDAFQGIKMPVSVKKPT